MENGQPDSSILLELANGPISRTVFEFEGETYELR